jgi:hypothetical protein
VDRCAAVQASTRVGSRQAAVAVCSLGIDTLWSNRGSAHSSRRSHDWPCRRMHALEQLRLSHTLVRGSGFTVQQRCGDRSICSSATLSSFQRGMVAPGKSDVARPLTRELAAQRQRGIKVLMMDYSNADRIQRACCFAGTMSLCKLHSTPGCPAAALQPDITQIEAAISETSSRSDCARALTCAAGCLAETVAASQRCRLTSPSVGQQCQLLPNGLAEAGFIRRTLACTYLAEGLRLPVTIGRHRRALARWHLELSGSKVFWPLEISAA